MLPSNAISVTPQYAPYQYPDSSDILSTASLEYGGVAISDPSQGRLVKVWRAYIVTVANVSTINVAPYITGTPVTAVYTGGLITSVSLAFDASMNPTICFVEAGTLKLRWYNTLTSAYQVDSYAPATSGRVSTDDKRKGQEGASDVIFAYTRGGTLYWRQERDRYGVEYTVGPSYALVLRRLGMNQKFRLQFELVSA